MKTYIFPFHDMMKSFVSEDSSAADKTGGSNERKPPQSNGGSDADSQFEGSILDEIERTHREKLLLTSPPPPPTPIGGTAELLTNIFSPIVSMMGSPTSGREPRYTLLLIHETHLWAY